MNKQPAFPINKQQNWKPHQKFPNYKPQHAQNFNNQQGYPPQPRASPIMYRTAPSSPPMGNRKAPQQFVSAPQYQIVQVNHTYTPVQKNYHPAHQTAPQNYHPARQAPPQNYHPAPQTPPQNYYETYNGEYYTEEYPAHQYDVDYGYEYDAGYEYDQQYSYSNDQQYTAPANYEYDASYSQYPAYEWKSDNDYQSHAQNNDGNYYYNQGYEYDQFGSQSHSSGEHNYSNNYPSYQNSSLTPQYQAYDYN